MLDVEAAGEAFARSVAAVVTTGDVVEVDGPDAASYLQGQLSQDVAALPVGGSAPSLILQPQGRIDAWIRVTRVAPDRYWLDVATGFGSAVLARLQRFKLRVDLELRLLAAVPVVAVRGPGASGGAAALGFDPLDGVVEAAWDAGVARGGPAGFDLIGPGVTVPRTVPEAPVEALEALRISLGVPAMGHELDESTIPAATGVVEESVSFTKGCYTGQELVARLDSRGSNTPTRLRFLRPGSPAPLEPGADITVDGEVVGQLTSYAARAAAGPVGLGYLKRSVELPATAVVVDRDGQPVTVEVGELPTL